MRKIRLQLKRETVRVLARRDLATVAAGDAVADGITRGSRCDPPPPPL